MKKKQAAAPECSRTSMRIKIESPTSEFRVEMKEHDKVKDLVKIIKQAWGSEYMTLHCNSAAEMNSDSPLTAYNLRDGSVVKVRVFADAPN
nr:hypothetical protein A4A49_13655 [Ipomoea batatas]GMD39490.1 hypothetical protein A4A49_13655 [Ipomoea batatas]GMD41584.1 hypothetical protein A4A49_13655 [Ipomoea batatas]GMD46176.1 hypothetical protein A4A49_13655 [Ipomoea batatas]